MLTSTRGSAVRRACEAITAARLASPATIANTVRNARAETGRHARWAPARDAAWQVIAPLLSPRCRVAVVGAGNGDTLPLERIAVHAARLTLIDLDGVAMRAACRRLSRAARAGVEPAEHDVTAGAADAIVAAAAAGRGPTPVAVPEQPLPGSPYDLVIGDLFYSQLLYPALSDLKVPGRRVTACLDRYGPPLTRAVVARMHASAPYRHVLHLHDPIAWWPGHDQPVAVEEILATAARDIDAALALVRTGAGPRHTEPRDALRDFRIPIQYSAVWCWPFTAGVDYLVAATVAGAPISIARPADRR